MSLANFKPKRIASALRGFLAAARLSCSFLRETSVFSRWLLLSLHVVLPQNYLAYVRRWRQTIRETKTVSSENGLFCRSARLEPTTTPNLKTHSSNSVLTNFSLAVLTLIFCSARWPILLHISALQVLILMMTWWLIDWYGGRSSARGRQTQLRWENN